MMSATFHLQKICKHVTPSHRDMSIQKAEHNEITEQLPFTVCKVELRGKAIVLQSCFKLTHLGHWSTIMGKTEGKRRVTK